MFHRKPQLGLMGVFALDVNLMAYVHTVHARFLEALEGLESPATSCIGQLSYPGKDGKLSGMHPPEIGRTVTASGQWRRVNRSRFDKRNRR
jgi:hypothetical protein